MTEFTISVATPKGGVGKTTTAVNLAVALGMKYKRVLLIDADPSGYCSTSLGFSEDTIRGDLRDVLDLSKPIDDVIHKTEQPYLEFIPFRKMTCREEMSFQKLNFDELLFQRILKSKQHYYDYIIIDCPPVLSGMTRNALVASDSVIIPVNAAKYALDAIEKMIEFVNDIQSSANEKLKVEGILLTMHETNTKASFNIKKVLFAKYPNLTFKTSIPKNIQIAETTFYGKPILLHNRDAKSSTAYLKLVNEVIDKHETSMLMSISGFDHVDFIDTLD
jgi:chromosome partitioning protein